MSAYLTKTLCRRLLLILLVATLVLSPALPAAAQAPQPSQTFPGCEESTLGKQQILTCLPADWNHTLIVYAHGFVPPQLPLELPVGELSRFDIGGQSVVSFLLSQGFAFATTSYSKNGWAVGVAGDDLNALVDYFKKHVASHANPVLKVLIIGASEGGLITTMVIEKHPEIYDGGLALCGVEGGAPYQVKYLGDFRVVFDYFFPNIFDFGVVNVPTSAADDWVNGIYPAKISTVVVGNPSATQQLFNVTGAAVDTVDLVNTQINTTLAALGYSILETPDLIDTAKGNPYGNRLTWYSGSNNDLRLNLGVERVSARFKAQQYMREYYQTTGNLQRPLVTLHTTQDPDVPFVHELIYFALTALRGRLSNLTVLPVTGYGHCAFKPEQVLGAFAWLLLRVNLTTSSQLDGYMQTLPVPLTEAPSGVLDLIPSIERNIYLPVTVK